MGLLQPSDWKAEWIGYDKPRAVALPDAPFEGARWIWHAADEGGNKPKSHRLFVTSLDIPHDAKVEKAELIVADDDGFRFTINSKLVASSGTDGFDKPKSADVTGDSSRATTRSASRPRTHPTVAPACSPS